MKFLPLKILVIGLWAITKIKFRKNAKSFKLYDFARFSPICNVYMNRCREIIRFRTFIMVDRAAKCWGVKNENMKKTQWFAKRPSTNGQRLFFVYFFRESNESNEGFCFLKLSEFKQMKSFVRIGRNFKAKMALNNKEWHVKTYIQKSRRKTIKICAPIG